MESIFSLTCMGDGESLYSTPSPWRLGKHPLPTGMVRCFFLQLSEKHSFFSGKENVLSEMGLWKFPLIKAAPFLPLPKCLSLPLSKNIRVRKYKT